MMSVRDHYESPLAEHYSRMFGDFEAKVAEQRALLERLGVGPDAPRGDRRGSQLRIRASSPLRSPVSDFR